MFTVEDSTKSGILLEFLEVAFHSILFLRKVYPAAIFKLKKKYEIPVQVSIHPKVNEYISQCLKAAKDILRWDKVNKISLVIETADGLFLEKYVFEIHQPSECTSDCYFVKTEEVFRDYLLKLSLVTGRASVLPENCTFQIQITTNEQSSVRLNENVSNCHFPWIEAEDIHKLTSIMPLKTLDTDNLRIKMYIQK